MAKYKILIPRALIRLKNGRYFRLRAKETYSTDDPEEIEALDHSVSVVKMTEITEDKPKERKKGGRK